VIAEPQGKHLDAGHVVLDYRTRPPVVPARWPVLEFVLAMVWLTLSAVILAGFALFLFVGIVGY
jgi:hypothetical protein